MRALVGFLLIVCGAYDSDLDLGLAPILILTHGAYIVNGSDYH